MTPTTPERTNVERANWQWRKGPVEPGPPSSSTSTASSLMPPAASTSSTPGRRDWTAFFEACGDDPVIEEVARLLELLDSSLAVILLTGRPGRVRPQTLAWLERYGLRWDLLVMRDRGDYAFVTDFKQGVVEDLRRHGFDLRLALEDDPPTTPCTWPRVCPASTSTPAITSEARARLIEAARHR